MEFSFPTDWDAFRQRFKNDRSYCFSRWTVRLKKGKKHVQTIIQLVRFASLSINDSKGYYSAPLLNEGAGQFKKAQSCTIYSIVTWLTLIMFHSETVAGWLASFKLYSSGKGLILASYLNALCFLILLLNITVKIRIKGTSRHALQRPQWETNSFWRLNRKYGCNLLSRARCNVRNIIVQSCSCTFLSITSGLLRWLSSNREYNCEHLSMFDFDWWKRENDRWNEVLIKWNQTDDKYWEIGLAYRETK